MSRGLYSVRRETQQDYAIASYAECGRCKEDPREPPRRHYRGPKTADSSSMLHGPRDPTTETETETFQMQKQPSASASALLMRLANNPRQPTTDIRHRHGKCGSGVAGFFFRVGCVDGSSSGKCGVLAGRRRMDLESGEYEPSSFGTLPLRVVGAERERSASHRAE